MSNFSHQDCLKIIKNYRHELIVFKGKMYNKEELVQKVIQLENKNINFSELYAALHDAVSFYHRGV